MQFRSHALPQRIHAIRAPLSPGICRIGACCKQPRRHYSRRLDSSEDRKNIAILGGGITGLATAHYLTKTLRNAHITVYEAKPQLGGWLQSKRVEVPGGNVLFEQGPRTLRQGTSALVTRFLVIAHPVRYTLLALLTRVQNDRSKSLT